MPQLPQERQVQLPSGLVVSKTAAQQMLAKTVEQEKAVQPPPMNRAQRRRIMRELQKEMKKLRKKAKRNGKA